MQKNLPAYSPQFTPIEICFSIIKRNLRTIWSKGDANLNNKSSTVYFLKAFKHLFKNMYSSINDHI